MSQEAAEEQRINDRLAEAEASIKHLRHCARLQDSATAAVMERAERAEAELAEYERTVAHMRDGARLQDSATAALREQLRLCNIDQANAEAENAALREDAERYRWLRDGEIICDIDYPAAKDKAGNTLWLEELDAAIDAAKGGSMNMHKIPQGEPVAYVWDEATYPDNDVRGRGWREVMGRHHPNNPAMTRNVVPLYAAPPTDGVDELAALQSELAEQCRLNGMGQEREARLMAQLQEAERKLAELMKEGRE